MTTNYCRKLDRALRTVALGGAALFLSAASIFSSEPGLAAEGGDAATAGTSAEKSSKDQSLPDLSLEELINVKITTASKTEEKQSDAPGIVSVVTNDEINRFGGLTLKDILERVPGLIGSSVFMTDRSMISIRGDQVSNSGEHVLLLINGRPVREVQEGGIKSEILETFPVDAIERIEVVKGPGSVLYGTTAFAGVINVITKEPKANGISVTGLKGDEGAWGARADASYKIGDLGIFAAGQWLEKADWHVDYVAAGPVGNISQPINIPNVGGGAFLGMNYKDFNLMGSYNSWKTAYFIPDFVPIFPPAIGVTYWQKLFSNLGYDSQINDTWRTTANATYTRSWLQTSENNFPGVRRDSFEALAEWANFIKLSEKSTLTLGGFVTRIDGTETGNGTLTSQGARTDLGMYTQIDYQLLKNLKVIAGAQANKIQHIDWDVVPRAGIIWHPIPKLNVKALYGQAFRAPSINETSLNDPGLAGNPNLKPERVGTFDLGISYETDQAEIGVDFFRSELTDIIFQDRTGFPTYENQTATTVIEGAEIEGKYYVTREWFLTGSFIYQTSWDDTGNKNVSPLSNYGAKAGISYVSPRGFTASLFEIYQGNMDNKYHSTLNPSPGAYNKLNAHLEWNLSKFFRWKTGFEASVMIEAQNLLDQSIWLPAWGLAPGQSIPYEKGRALYGGLTVKF